eukprot:865213-Lingulodinium_polyedra.AAC.1
MATLDKVDAAKIESGIKKLEQAERLEIMFLTLDARKHYRKPERSGTRWGQSSSRFLRTEQSATFSEQSRAQCEPQRSQNRAERNVNPTKRSKAKGGECK